MEDWRPTKELDDLLKAEEDEHLEFKEAKNTFHMDTLVGYCAALANEGGGRLVLGVSAKCPHKVVGTKVHADTDSAKRQLLNTLRLRVDVEEINHPDGRVLVFRVPPRPPGTPLLCKGRYLMRSGESLVPMSPDELKRVFSETGPDYSAEICKKATFEDLAPEAIQRFRKTWLRKSGNDSLGDLPDKQLLADAELLVDGSPSYASLVLLGKREALGRHLAQAEVIFEYRSTEESLSYQQREEYRAGFFLFHDDLWETINARNDTQQFQDGLFRFDIPTFNEAVVREALLNAICHRDYRDGNSVFVRQYPRKLVITSPGGFIGGVTPENILWRQAWRNRRIAEALAKCGLVERSGQGADLMFDHCIRESKAVPDFTGTDEHQVTLTLRGEVQDVRFLRFLEKLGREKSISFATDDLVVLDCIQHDKPIPDVVKEGISRLVKYGVIERIGRGRGTRYILSREFYDFLGKRGTYTRRRGLPRKRNKALLLDHLDRYRKEGSRLHELMEILPDLKRSQIKGLLRELRTEGRIRVVGRTRGARWFPVEDDGRE